MITQKLLEFHKNPPTIKLDKVASSKGFSYKYASLGGVLDAIRGPLSNLGIVFYQRITPEGLETVLVDTEDNTKIEFLVPMKFGDDVQLVGKMITYLRRYSLLTVLGIVGEEDTDGTMGTSHDAHQNSTDTATEKQIALLKQLGGQYTIGEIGEMIGNEKMINSEFASKKLSEIKTEVLMKLNKNKVSKIIEALMNKNKGEVDEF